MKAVGASVAVSADIQDGRTVRPLYRKEFATLFSKNLLYVATKTGVPLHVTTPAYFNTTVLHMHPRWFLCVLGMQQVGKKNGALSEHRSVWSKGAWHSSTLTNTPEDNCRVHDKVQELFVSLVPLHAKRLQIQVMKNNGQCYRSYPSRSEDCL